MDATLPIPLLPSELIPAIVETETHFAAGEYAQSLGLVQACLKLDPENAGLHHLAAQAAYALDRFDAAETHWRLAIELLPDLAEAHFHLGLLYRRLKNLLEAERCFRKTLDLLPDAAAHCNLGLVLTAGKRFEEAEQHLRQAAEMFPESTEIASNLGNLLAQTGRIEEAQIAYFKAIELNPASAAAWCNLGVLLADERQDEEAERCFRQALGLLPEHALARINLGYLLLSQGRWDEGWGYHEARFTPAAPDDETFYPILPFPQWQGETLTGKSILVWLEQGYGDVVQFCRYLPLLKDKGAVRVTLLCQPALMPLLSPLLETMPQEICLLSYDDISDDKVRHDYWTFLLSIPHYCGTRVDNIPAEIPYLKALPERLEKWRPQLPREGLRVGLVWKGNLRHSNDIHRSLPGLTTLAALWDVPGVKFISLQKGQAEVEANLPLANQPLLHLGSDIEDFADTAAIIAQLDLLICVDTAAVHVAGALGKPCWVMLPEFKTDWRWLRGRSDSPWYPGVLRLFRQQQRDDWAPVVMEIQQALLQFAACPATN